MRDGNYELSQELAARFRQTLFLKFHHPFQVVDVGMATLQEGQTAYIFCQAAYALGSSTRKYKDCIVTANASIL